MHVQLTAKEALMIESAVSHWWHSWHERDKVFFCLAVEYVFLHFALCWLLSALTLVKHCDVSLLATGQQREEAQSATLHLTDKTSDLRIKCICTCQREDAHGFITMGC